MVCQKKKKPSGSRIFAKECTSCKCLLFANQSNVFLLRFGCCCKFNRPSSYGVVEDNICLSSKERLFDLSIKKACVCIAPLSLETAIELKVSWDLHKLDFHNGKQNCRQRGPLNNDLQKQHWRRSIQKPLTWTGLPPPPSSQSVSSSSSSITWLLSGPIMLSTVVRNIKPWNRPNTTVRRKTCSQVVYIFRWRWKMVVARQCMYLEKCYEDVGFWKT